MWGNKVKVIQRLDDIVNYSREKRFQNQQYGTMHTPISYLAAIGFDMASRG